MQRNGHPLKLKTQEQFEQAREQSLREPVVLFKHSITCPVSSTARRQIEQICQEGDLPVYELIVQESRALSHAIAGTLNIRHESPQVIVLYKDRPIFHASHRQVTAEAVRRTVASVHREADV